MRVLVCGSREWDDMEIMDALLSGLDYTRGEPLTIIEGGARGADALAVEWSQIHGGVTVWQFPADWDRYGKGAGPIRNQQMLDEGKRWTRGGMPPTRLVNLAGVRSTERTPRLLFSRKETA